MDIHGNSAQAIAIASSTVLTTLLKRLEDKSIINRSDTRDILKSAADQISTIGSSEAKQANALVLAMLAELPENRS